MATFYRLMGVSPDRDLSTDFFSSWLLSALQLACLRSLICLYAFTVIIFQFIWYGVHGEDILNRESFSYFTNLGYWGLAFYFLFSAAHGFSFARTGQAWLARWPRPLQALHVLFYTTVTTFPILTTIVYWALLFSGFASPYKEWSNVRLTSSYLSLSQPEQNLPNHHAQVSFHALNTVYALLEILLPNTHPFPLLHLAFLCLLLLLYLALAYLTHATEGFYTYSFLDIQTKGSAVVTGYCFGILAAICVIFGIVWGLIWVRRRVTLGKAVGGAGARYEERRSWRKRRSRREMGDVETAAFAGREK